MSDWEFLHEMRDRGYSAEDIADAAGVGYAPWEQNYLSRDWVEAELKNEPLDDVQSLRDMEPFRSRDGFPFSLLDQMDIFEDLVDCAERHFENTGRYLQVWGELGEIYAEIRFALRRHATHEAGSDGTIGGKLVEVKTVSPEKSSDRVSVRRQGNFEQLLVVRIDADFKFKGKLFDRNQLTDSGGQFLHVRMRENEDPPADPSSGKRN